RGDRSGTLPDPDRSDRADVDDAEDGRPRTLVERHAATAAETRRSTSQGEELSMAVATRWGWKTLFWGSIIAFVNIAAGALGTRIGLWPFTVGLLMFAIGALLAVIGLIWGIIAAIIVLSRGRVTERNGVLIAVAVCLVVAAFIVPQLKTAFSV